jgi:hypothetical protein
MFFHLMFFLFMFLPVTSVFADAPLQAEEDPDSAQTDMYYSAMIRSIDLDKGRWKTFSRSMEGGPWFYDAQGLVRKGSIVTTGVTVFPHPLKTASYHQVFNDHTKIRKIVFTTEIDCAKHTYRQPQISVYGYYDELLAQHSNTTRQFSAITQGTTTDTLQGLVCGKGKNKKR